METKICRTCKIEKSIDDFLWRNKKKGLKHNECSLCYKITRKKSYDNNKEYYYNKNKVKRNKTSEWYEEFKKDKKCLFCDEDESVCLDFHHINDETKDFNLANMRYSTYSINKIKKEIDKCIIVCSNCHRKIHKGIIKI